jgi:hypothetical protein
VAKSSNRPEYDGHKFRSDSERDFYVILENKKRKGIIYDFGYESETHTLINGYIDTRGKKIAPITHTIDFKIWLSKDNYIYVDTKGGNFHEQDAVLKKKMWESKFPDISYYWIGLTPGYMGKRWVETSKYYDFLSKLNDRYKKKYPEEKKLDWRKKTFKYDENMWGDDFDFDKVADCFYVWKKTKTLKKAK